MKKFFIKIILLTCLFLVFPKITLAFDCENRNDACPKDGYPTCEITGQCTPPNCLVEMVLVGGSWKLYCAKPASTPTPAQIPTIANSPTPTTNCPICTHGNHWNSAYKLCCKNEEVPECKSTSPATFENCTTGQTCQLGVGCISTRPTPAETCGYPSFPGKEQCCFDQKHDPKYFCFEGSPDKQAGGCLCYSTSLIKDLCENQPKKCDECLKAGKMWTALGCIPTNNLNEFAGWILSKVVFIASGIAFLLMAFGAFQVITSAGDPKKTQAGKELITSALSGLLFIILSIFLLKLIGVDILKIPGFG